MTETNQTPSIEATEAIPTPATETPAIPTLVVDDMYEHGNRVMIAISSTTMTPIMESGVYVVADETTKLMVGAGSPEWCARMVGVRAHILAENRRTRDNHAALQNYLTGLKEALLEKAIEKDFCSEYDEFAAEWELLPRHREYQVTVTLTVQATDEDNAQEIVENAMNTYYVDAISDYPDIDVQEVR